MQARVFMNLCVERLVCMCLLACVMRKKTSIVDDADLLSTAEYSPFLLLPVFFDLTWIVATIKLWEHLFSFSSPSGIHLSYHLHTAKRRRERERCWEKKSERCQRTEKNQKQEGKGPPGFKGA
mmetsp:Transcript_20361/g.40772  ORF Transcript_20361/g.40772 Transcript_20361/m.40772 type:complete len:123 (-) Transcript_20361:68-436(-)